MGSLPHALWFLLPGFQTPRWDGFGHGQGESQATELRVESGLWQEREGCFWLPCQGVEAYPGLSET